jgi:uncharacterized protein involved in exopolysaccharide biosynthesis
MRQKALREAEANIAYLREELGKTNLIPLQQTVGRLLETELQKRMLARGNEEFSFLVIDSAQPRKKPSRPKRLLLISVAGVFGCMFSIFIVLVRHSTMRMRLAVPPTGGL